MCANVEIGLGTQKIDAWRWVTARTAVSESGED